MLRLALAIAAISVIGCGNDKDPQVDAPLDDGTPDDGTRDDGSTDGPPIDAPPTGFTLSSNAFLPGGAIPGMHTCTGVDTSPQLSWVNPPAGTKSFALVLTDLDIGNGLLHWVIYDIPAAATSLDADVDKVYAPPDVATAHQTLSYNNTTRGYVGPCPPQPEQHDYVFGLYALDVTTIPGASMSTTSVEVLQQINSHRIAAATLAATYKQ